MRPILRSAVFAAAVVSSPGPAAAAVDCAALLAGLRVTPIAPVTRDDDDDTCIARNFAALTMNIDAALQAIPVEGPSALIGTWLGDDVALPLAGVMTPGQEVLRISQGPQDGTIVVRQFWYKARLPGRTEAPFDAQGDYVGLVSQAVLTVRAGGYFTPDTFANPVIYAPGRFQFRRSNELFVLARLNHFDRTGRFLRHGDTMVLQSERFPVPPQTDIWTNTSTYTRVTDAAPDIALLLVATQDLSQLRFFDCFAHQISAGRGPLLTALAPHSLDEVQAWMLRILSFHRRLAQLQDPDFALPEGMTRAEVYGQFQTEFVTLMGSPLAQRLAQMAGTPDALGCVRPN